MAGDELRNVSIVTMLKVQDVYDGDMCLSLLADGSMLTFTGGTSNQVFADIGAHKAAHIVVSLSTELSCSTVLQDASTQRRQEKPIGALVYRGPQDFSGSCFAPAGPLAPSSV